MTRLSWGSVGERYFETGVDRGVLYNSSGVGVPWNGLVSINETPTGGEPVPYYLDGHKYLNLAASEEFELSLTAFSSPREFDECDGTTSIALGLFVTQQPRKSFGLCYRTAIGNDVDGVEHGYKLHLVYNALAGSADRDIQTFSDSTEPSTFTWAITTLPPTLSGHKSTAHLVIDSRMTPPKLMAIVEAMLYGDDNTEARLPSPQELSDLFNLPGLVIATNRIKNPSFEKSEGLIEVRRNFIKNPMFRNNNAGWQANSAALFVGEGLVDIPESATIALLPVASDFVTVTEGETWTISFTISIDADRPPFNLQLSAQALLANEGGTSTIALGSQVEVVPGSSRIFTVTAVIPTGVIGIRGVFLLSSIARPGRRLKMSNAMVEKQKRLLPYFDGDTEDANGNVYTWVGAANATDSIQRLPGVFGVASNFGKAVQSSEWSSSGFGHSVRMIPIGTNQTTFVNPDNSTDGLMKLGMVAGKTYTFLAKCRLSESLAGLLHANSRRMVLQYLADGMQYVMSNQPPNLAGVYQHRIVVTLPENTIAASIQMFNGAIEGNGDIWWDDFLCVEGVYTGPYFDGDTQGSPGHAYAWLDEPHDSESVYTSWY